MNEQDLLLAMLSELGNEVRSRREPEYIYTAASVGAFGAIAWGVATIATVASPKPVSWFLHPANVAAIGSSLLAVAVIAKIVREHRIYQKLREEQIVVASRLATLYEVPIEQLPAGFRPSKDGRPGYLWSIGVVLCAALAAILFCISVWCFR